LDLNEECEDTDEEMPELVADIGVEVEHEVQQSLERFKVPETSICKNCGQVKIHLGAAFESQRGVPDFVCTCNYQQSIAVNYKLTHNSPIYPSWFAKELHFERDHLQFFVYFWNLMMTRHPHASLPYYIWPYVRILAKGINIEKVEGMGVGSQIPFLGTVVQGVWEKFNLVDLEDHARVAGIFYTCDYSVRLQICLLVNEFERKQVPFDPIADVLLKAHRLGLERGWSRDCIEDMLIALPRFWVMEYVLKWRFGFKSLDGPESAGKTIVAGLYGKVSRNM
jgi:hypothetical protein